jgi:hypothetical protein
MSHVILWPPIAFIVLLLVGYLVYRLGAASGPKPVKQDGKLSSYACGEDIPGKKVQHGYHLFHFAFFFTVLHVAALVIATVPSGSIALVGIVYLVAALAAVAILLND